MHGSIIYINWSNSSGIILVEVLSKATPWKCIFHVTQCIWNRNFQGVRKERERTSWLQVKADAAATLQIYDTGPAGRLWCWHAHAHALEHAHALLFHSWSSRSCYAFCMCNVLDIAVLLCYVSTVLQQCCIGDLSLDQGSGRPSYTEPPPSYSGGWYAKQCKNPLGLRYCTGCTSICTGLSAIWRGLPAAGRPSWPGSGLWQLI